MYLFAYIININLIRLLQITSGWFEAINRGLQQKFLLVSKCSWSFPNRSVLIVLSFSSSLLMVLFGILL